MALIDNLPGAGAAGGVAAVAGDVLLNGGEVLVSLLGFLVTQPDAWLTVVMYGERLAGMVGWLPSRPLRTLVVVGLVLAIVVSLTRTIQKWRESRD